MSTSDDDFARECVITQVLSARTLPQIAAATEALSQWLKEYPDETGLEDGFGQLAMMEEAAMMGAFEPLPDEPARTPALA